MDSQILKALSESYRRNEDYDKALAERAAKIQAQMDAAWAEHNRKVESDRKAQMSQAWYLYK